MAVLLGLAASGQVMCTLAQFDMEYDDQDAAEEAGWEFEGLWRLVSARELSGEPSYVRDFPSAEKAAYFGVVTDEGTGTYKIDGRARGSLTTPVITLSHCEGCENIVVKFKYYREVEYYTKAPYDKTWVKVHFVAGGDNGEDEDGEVVFELDSRTPSEPSWKTFTSEPIPVPEGATAVKVVFWFDSVDGFANDYLGWLIDDVEITCTRAPVKIITPALAQGVVGESYESAIEATGPADAIYEWTARGLPDRLYLETDGSNVAYIRGIPAQAGTFPVTIRVKADRGGPGFEDEKTFNLIIRVGVATEIFSEDFQTDCTPELPKGWTCTGLWHVTNVIRGYYTGCGIAYYGKDDNTSPNYNTGSRTRGYLTSPVIEIDPAYSGYALVVEFFSLREVESYAPGGYDKAWVEVKLGNGDWVKIWERDSANPEDDGVTYQIVTDIVIPSSTRPIPLQIRFGFDSVDSYGNNYLGWAIDNVAIYVIPVPLRITVTCPLPEGSVGDEYRVELTAQGGAREKIWEVSGLPDGLAVRQENGVWVITGVPRQIGRFLVTLRVRDIQGNEDEKTCMLEITEKKVLLKENFEDPEAWAEWTRDGLWQRIEAHPNPIVEFDGYVAYYGLPAGHYDTNARTTGALTSPAFDTLGAQYAQISFDSWREVEYFPGGSYDRTYVQVRFLVGTTWTPWTTVWALDSSTPSTRKWDTVQFTIPVNTGATKMQIRFVFDSVDKYYNRFVGWLVDNVKVIRTNTGPASAALMLPEVMPRDKITVFNVPNPVRDVHTTTFVVRGVQAEAIRVEIYDLTGRLVYRGEATGNELVWHTEDLSGLPLANGVYLYKVYVKVNGTWIVTETQKLVILR